MDSAKETVESTIKLAESKIFKLLDEKLKTISNIDDLDTINTAVLHGIVSASQAYSHEATYSWNKAAGKAVIANVISNELRSLVGEIAIGAISINIQESFTSMSLTVMAVVGDQLKKLIKDGGGLPFIRNLTKIKFVIQQMKLGKGLQDPKFDLVWDEIKGFDADTPFTVVALAPMEGNFKTFAHVAVIPDMYLKGALANPFLAPFAKSIFSFFTEIGDLERVGLDFDTANSGDFLSILQSGCELKSLPDMEVYNVNDYSSKSRSLNDNFWVNFWKYFFQNLIAMGDKGCKLASTCQINTPACENPSFVAGDIIKLANEDYDLPKMTDYGCMTALCNVHLGSAYTKGGNSNMITNNNTIALQFPLNSPHPEIAGNKTFLDESGFNFITQCFQTLENRGLDDEGLYREVGVASKVTKLLSDGLDKKKLEKINLDDPFEWDTKTITSAAKTYLRNLPEPLMTFQMYSSFIAAAKLDDPECRVAEIALLADQLPMPNKRMLEMLCCHLEKVAAKSSQNMMSCENLGVCFGPTLLREEEESIEAIIDISFANAVVMILVENWSEMPLSQRRTTRRRAPSPPRLGAAAEFANPNLIENDDKSDPDSGEGANVKVFTEKDLSKSNDPCLLKVKLSTYGIKSISLEYRWHMKAKDTESIISLELEREGKVIASSNEFKCDARSLLDTDGLKIRESFSSTHMLVKKAARGDVLKVLKTTVNSNEITSSPKSRSSFKFKGSKSSQKKMSISGVIPDLKEFNFRVDVLPDSLMKIQNQQMGGALAKALPHHIYSLMVQIKVAVEEAVTETKEYAKVHANHIRSVSTIPFYGFCEGPTMIADMEDICLSHFNSLVSSKVCLIAIKSKVDVRGLKKGMLDYVASKEFEQRKKMFHKEFKKDDDKENLCVIS